MAHSDQNTATPQKRLACDRCHARKLRCFRDASMAECDRCIQRGYVCTYSPPLKSGRPKKGSSAVPKRIQETPGRDSLPDLDSSSLSSSSSISGADSIGISAPMPYPLHLSAGCEVMNDQIYLSPLEPTNSLYHVDAAPTSVAPTVLPTACRDTLNFKWLDMPMGRGDPSHHHHHHNHNHEQHQHRNKARETPSGDGSVSDVEWDSGLEALPMSVPHGLHTPDHTSWSQSSTPGGSTLPEIMHSLSRLQQEFVHFRSQSGSGNSQTNTGRPLPSFYPAFSPVNTILRPGQELVDLISRVFDECSFSSRGGQLPVRLTVDRRTLLPLILTPLSLLLSAYSDLLRDIGTASNKTQNPQNSNNPTCDSYFGSHPTSMSITSSPRETFVDDHQQDERSRQHNSNNTNIPVSRVPNSECPTSSMPSTPLVPDNLQLTLDAMNLNRPLQLALVTTVIKHHLTYLGDALEGYQVHHMHGPDLGISESFLSTSIIELRSSINVLLSEAQSLL